MKQIKKQALLFVLFITCLEASAQLVLVEARGDYYKQYEIKPFGERTFEPHFNFSFTGAAFTIPISDLFGNSYIINGKDTFYLNENHESDLAEQRVSNLISLPSPISQFRIHIDPGISKITIHLYNAGKTDISTLNTHRSWDSTACSKPIMIDQSVWRKDLPAPKVKPTFTETDHVVVHHTAGSNSATDHLTEIRNIYLYHTQTNGWDDIGYNYIIARDGTIYEGRDGQDSIENDFVKGAHFCARNANTMGVSLMGDYSIDLPTSYAINSLIRLLTWKLYKDTLDPYGFIWHPRINPDKNLAIICGHRDACPTECPGLSFYLMLSSLRNRVSDSIQKCAPLSFSNHYIDESIDVYPNPFSEELNIFSGYHQKIEVALFNQHGKLIFSRTILPESSILMNSNNLTPGLYILKTIKNNACFDQKIQKY